jgi:hypothetical protein
MPKAKKAKDTEATNNGNGVTIESILDHMVTDPQDESKAVRFGDLPIVSQVRMVIKATNELLSDSGAMSKEQIAKHEAAGTLDSAKAEARDKRWNSLLSGEFSVGARGPKLPETVRVYRDVLAGRFAKWWNAQRKDGAKMANGGSFPALSTVKAKDLADMHKRWEGVILPTVDGQPNDQPESVLARAEADRQIATNANVAPQVAFVVDIG